MKVLCTTESSLYRPEATRWRSRISLLEPTGELVVVLPCSMGKPYSTSKSHQIFRRVTKGFQEAILTSPFGVCPRELERTYPIQSYDVATTGDWSQEEIDLTGECLKNYVRDHEVIAHVSGGYREVCEQYMPHATFTCQDGRATSQESIHNLRNEIRKYKKAPGKERELNGLRSIARYQFNNIKADQLIPDGYRMKGRFNRRLFFNNIQIATLLYDTGLFSLNLQGGSLLQDEGLNWVEIDFNLETNTLFAPGVVDAFSGIVPKDEVVIIRNGEVVGVGKALLSGEEMIKAGKGVAVRVRHRVKGKTI
jgi:archaeosine synthase